MTEMNYQQNNRFAIEVHSFRPNIRKRYKECLYYKIGQAGLWL
jgi:hypothetical protein